MKRVFAILRTPETWDLLLILTTGFLSITWFKGNFVINVGDFVLPMNRLKYLLATAFTWDDAYSMGYFAPQQIAGLLPYGLYGAVTQWLGFSVVTYEKSLFYIWFAGSGAAMYYLCWIFRFSRFTRLLAALFYMLNPYALTVVWHVAHGYLPHPYAFIPFVLATYIAGLKNGYRVTVAVIIPVVWLFTANSYMNPAMAILHLVPVLAYAIYFLITNKDGHVRRKAVIFTTSLFASWILVNSFWLLILGASIREASHIELPTLLNDQGTQQLNSARIWDAFRLLGDWALRGSYKGVPFYSYGQTFTSTGFILISALIPLLACFACLRIAMQRKREYVFFYLLFVVTLFLAKGFYPPFEILNIWFYKLPFIGAAFRAVWQKWGMLLPLTLAPLIGLGVEEVYKVARASGRAVVAVGLTVLCIFLLFFVLGYPYWTGGIVQDGESSFPSERIRVPSYYEDAANWVNQDTADSRVFVLPLSKLSNYAYTWAHGFVGAGMHKWFFSRPVINANTGIFDVPLLIGAAIEDQAPGEGFGRLFGLLNLKYFLWSRDHNWDFIEGHPQWFQHSDDRIAQFLHSQRALHFAKRFGYLDLYEVDPAFFLPHLYAASHATVVAGGTESLVPLLKSSHVGDHPALLFMNQQEIYNQPDPHIRDLINTSTSVVYHNQTFFDLILESIGSEYHHAAGSAGTIDFKASSNGQFALFAKSARTESFGDGRDVPRWIPLTDASKLMFRLPGAEVIPPKSDDELTQMAAVAKQWSYYGKVNLQGGGAYSISIEKIVDASPLKFERQITIGSRARGEAATTLWTAMLPSEFPADYTTRGGNVPFSVYRERRRLKPTWGRWNGNEELFEIGRTGARQLVVNIPDRVTPRGSGEIGSEIWGPYSFSYVVPANISREISEVVLVPVSTLENQTKRVLSELNNSSRTLTSIFTRDDVLFDRKERSKSTEESIQLNSVQAGDTKISKGDSARQSFFITKAAPYRLRAKVVPLVRDSEVFLFPKHPDWHRELAFWKFGEAALLPGPSQPFLVSFRDHFYSVEQAFGRSWRWGTNNMRISIVNPGSRTIKARVKMNVITIRDRDLEIAVNEKPVLSTIVKSAYMRPQVPLYSRLVSKVLATSSPPLEKPDEPIEPTKIITPAVDLAPGENNMTFYTPQGTEVIDDDLGNGDRRSVSVQFIGDVNVETVTDDSPSAPLANVNREVLSRTPYTTSARRDELVLRMKMLRGPDDPEYILMGRDIRSSFPGQPDQSAVTGKYLEQYPLFRVVYYVQSEDLQGLDVFVGIDRNADGITDEYLQVGTEGGSRAIPTRAGWHEMNVDLFKRIRASMPIDAYSHSRDLRVNQVLLLWHKAWGVDMRPGERQGTYEFKLGELQLYSNKAVFFPTASVEDISWGAENVDYTKVVSPDSISVTADFQDRQAGIIDQAKSIEKMFRLKSDKLISGEVAAEDEKTITLVKAKVVDQKSAQRAFTAESIAGSETSLLKTEPLADRVVLNREDVSMTLELARRIPRWEPESVNLIMPGRELNGHEPDILESEFKLQAPNVQMVRAFIGLDMNGDMKTDDYVLAGRTERLRNWQLAGSYQKIDLYQAALPSDFPVSYTSEFGERFAIMRRAKVLPLTWGEWFYHEELAQVGFGNQRSVVISVPSGTVPTDDEYSITYLPLPFPSTVNKGYQTLQFDMREIFDTLRTVHTNARVTEIVIRLEHIHRAVKPGQSTAAKGTFTFDLKPPVFLTRVAFPVRSLPPDLEKRLQESALKLVAIDGKPVSFQQTRNNWLLNVVGEWLESKPVSLHAGVHPDGMEFLSNPSFESEVVEITESAPPPAENATLTFRRVNRTRYEANINATGSFWLVFSEAFHKGWSAYIEDSTFRSDQPPTSSSLLTAFQRFGHREVLPIHSVINGYANGWYVNRTGTYTISIEFLPQRTYETGVLISFTSVVTFIVAIVIGYRRRLIKRVTIGENSK